MLYAHSPVGQGLTPWSSGQAEAGVFLLSGLELQTGISLHLIPVLFPAADARDVIS